MKIHSAKITDLQTVKSITYTTIEKIYPHYYPRGAVDLFLMYHNEENIAADINLEKVFILEEKDIFVGTVTIKENEISRLFVLPQYQGKGYGRALLDFSEAKIAERFEKIYLAASFPAKEIYLKRGYTETASHTLAADNGDFLFYDDMEKSKNSVQDN